MKIKVIVICVCLFTFASCGREHINRTSSLAPLIRSYEENNRQIIMKHQQYMLKGIQRLDVVQSTDGDYTVNLDLNKALVDSAVRQILIKTDIPYNLPEGMLYGVISTKFQDIPLLDALNLLLKPQYMLASMQNGILVIEYGEPTTYTANNAVLKDSSAAGSSIVPGTGAQSFSGKTSSSLPEPKFIAYAASDPWANAWGDSGSSGSSDSSGSSSTSSSNSWDSGSWDSGSSSSSIPSKAEGSISIQVPLQYMKSDDAVTFLTHLFPSGDDRYIRYTAMPYTNTVTILGAKQDVIQAAQVLRQADSQQEHVFIEVLVVEYNRSDFEELRADVQNVAKGNFSNGFLNFGALEGDSAGFNFTEYASNTAQFTAMIKALLVTEKARLITRPYLSTLSGNPAVLNIASERNIIIEIPQEGAAISSTVDISAGLKLNITPTILYDHRIRMEVSVENSEFVPTAENIASEKDTNEAQTVVEVYDGESIIIGGFSEDRHAEALSGLHGLRKIPILNILFADRSETIQNKEIVFFIIPYIWDPGLKTPLPLREPLDGMDENVLMEYSVR